MFKKIKRTVIVVVDGLSYKIFDKLNFPNTKNLIEDGSYFKECYFLPTAHPRGWFHTCSLGNIALVTGTIFFREGAEQIQQCFKPSRDEIRKLIAEKGLHQTEVREILGVTAHVAGGGNAYQSISIGYDFVNIGRYNDDEVVENTISLVQKNPTMVFMLIHLQDLGVAGSDIRHSQDKIPTIWSEGSRYSLVAKHADELIGKLVETLKTTGNWTDTIMVVTADHGQADTGWHPPFDEDSWRAPLIIKGPGVKAGKEFSYAEIIDVAPTVCELAGVRKPSDAIGIVLNEALISPKIKPKGRDTTLKELDETMKRYVSLRERLIEAVERKSSEKLKKIINEADKKFFSIERLVEWKTLGSLNKLVEADRKALHRLEEEKG